MSKESVEGYEGGNWPAKNGNPSGGGRGNAESSESWNDCEDYEGSGGSCGYNLWDTIARNEAAMQPRMPNIPHGAKKITGTLKSVFSGINDVKLWLEEYPNSTFKIHQELHRFCASENKWELLKMNLIGDSVTLTVHQHRRHMDTDIYRMTNDTIDKARIDAESSSRFGRSHELENELRAGKLSSQAASVMYNPKIDTGGPRWFVKSGDHLCKNLAFASQKLASYWMDMMLNEIAWRDGPSFKLRNGLFKCAIVDRHGNLPKQWSLVPHRYFKEHHELKR